jgi:hypothetical protein
MMILVQNIYNNKHTSKILISIKMYFNTWWYLNWLNNKLCQLIWNIWELSTKLQTTTFIITLFVSIETKVFFLIPCLTLLLYRFHGFRLTILNLLLIGCILWCLDDSRLDGCRLNGLLCWLTCCLLSWLTLCLLRRLTDCKTITLFLFWSIWFLFDIINGDIRAFLFLCRGLCGCWNLSGLSACLTILRLQILTT